MSLWVACVKVFSGLILWPGTNSFFFFCYSWGQTVVAFCNIKWDKTTALMSREEDKICLLGQIKKVKGAFSVQDLICLFEASAVVSSQLPVTLKPVCSCQWIQSIWPQTALNGLLLQLKTKKDTWKLVSQFATSACTATKSRNGEVVIALTVHEDRGAWRENKKLEMCDSSLLPELSKWYSTEKAVKPL